MIWILTNDEFNDELIVVLLSAVRNVSEISPLWCHKPHFLRKNGASAKLAALKFNLCLFYFFSTSTQDHFLQKHKRFIFPSLFSFLQLAFQICLRGQRDNILPYQHTFDCLFVFNNDVVGVLINSGLHCIVIPPWWPDATLDLLFLTGRSNSASVLARCQNLNKKKKHFCTRL